jgi:hypothetical protein
MVLAEADWAHYDRKTVNDLDGTMDERVALIPESCRFKGTVDFVFHLDDPPANAQACPPWGRRRPACGTALGALTAIDSNRLQSIAIVKTDALRPCGNPAPPLEIAHWNWQHFPIGNIFRPERRPLRETPGARAACPRFGDAASSRVDGKEGEKNVGGNPVCLGVRGSVAEVRGAEQPWYLLST